MPKLRFQSLDLSDERLGLFNRGQFRRDGQCDFIAFLQLAVFGQRLGLGAFLDRGLDLFQFAGENVLMPQQFLQPGKIVRDGDA